MDSRAEFESEWSKRFSDHKLARRQTMGGDLHDEYRDSRVNYARIMWQASRQALSSCSEIPNSSGPASREALEGEAAAWLCLWPDGSPWGACTDYSSVEIWLRRQDEGRIVCPLYTHPASADVPEKWRTVMKELADSLESEIEARRSGDLDRRIERDLIVVKEARVLLAEQEQGQ